MPAFGSFGEFERTLVKVSQEIRDDVSLEITREQGERAEQILHEVADADIGAGSFSGWKRGSPIRVDAQLRTVRRTATLFAPTRQAAGVITVANEGRNQGNASGFAGPGVNRRTGMTARTRAGAVRRVRALTARRWNGTTRGYRTGDKVVARMEQELPPIAERRVRRALQRRFDVT